MKSLILPFLFLLGFSVNLCAQQILSIRGNDKWPYTYANDRLNKNDLGAVLQTNPKAYQLYQDTRTARFTSLFFGGVGGYLVGNQIGKKLVGGDGYRSNALIWGGGLVLIGTSLAIDGGANKRRRKAVNIYNRGSSLKNDKSSIAFSLGTTSTGVGLSVSF